MRAVDRGRVRIVSLSFLALSRLLLLPPPTVLTSRHYNFQDVDNNPTAFSKAYWEVNSLAVYTPGSAALDAQVPMLAGLLQGKSKSSPKSEAQEKEGTGKGRGRTDGKSKKGKRGH